MNKATESNHSGSADGAGKDNEVQADDCHKRAELDGESVVADVLLPYEYEPDNIVDGVDINASEYDASEYDDDEYDDDLTEESPQSEDDLFIERALAKAAMNAVEEKAAKRTQELLDDDFQIDRPLTAEEVREREKEIELRRENKRKKDEEAARKKAEAVVAYKQYQKPAMQLPTTAIERTTQAMLQEIPDGNTEAARLYACCRIALRQFPSEREYDEYSDAARAIRGFELVKPFSPPLDHAQIRHALDDVRWRHEVMEAAVWVGMRLPSQLLVRNQEIKELIPGVILAAQVGTLSGPKNHLKTKLGLDACISLATGTPFLDYFPVPRAVSTGIIAGEDSGRDIDEAIERICKAKDVDRRRLDGKFFVSNTVPELSSTLWFENMLSFIQITRMKYLFIDAVYLGLGGADQRSLQSMGHALAPIKRLSDDTGCAIQLALHHKIASSNRWPNLGDIAGVGYEELARSWLLLNSRRVWDPTTGQHCLRLVAGNKHGEQRYDLEVREGHVDDDGGRVWEPLVRRPNAEAAEEADEPTRQKSKSGGKLQEYRANVVGLLEKHPAGLSKTAIGNEAKVPEKRRDDVFAALVEDGAIVETQVSYSNQKTLKPGYKLRSP